jgi:predicted porin
MKKSLIALAVAGAFATPAFAATSNVDVYGIMHFAIEDSDVDNSDIAVVDRVSRIGFKGSEDLGGGLKAIWQIEQAINATGGGGAFGGASLRNTFVGLSGGFGTVLMGRHDTPYKMSTGKFDLFSDTVADYNAGAGVSVSVITTGTTTTVAVAGVIDSTHDLRSPQAIAYVSPNFSGLTLAGAVVATNTGSNLNSGDSVDAYSLSANYDNGPLALAAGYQKAEVIDSTAWKVGAGYAFGSLKFAGLYENVEMFGGDVDVTGWQLNAAYGMGAVTLKGAFGQKTVEVAGLDEDFDQWTVGVDYSLSKRTVAYALYTNAEMATFDVDLSVDPDVITGGVEDVGTWAIGLKHSF